MRDDPRGQVFVLHYSAKIGALHGHFRQYGFLRGKDFVILTCTSLAGPIEGMVEEDFEAMVTGATFGGPSPAAPIK